MRSLNVILMLLGALSVLMLGVVPAAAVTGEAPPCHEAVSTSQSQPGAPAPSGKAMAAMACCVSCVVAPVPQAPSRALAAHPETPATPAPTSLPIGLSPAPEHGPPKG